MALSGPFLVDQPNAYHTINISGNAQAILGNVISDDFSFRHGSNIDWKNTLRALYFEGMRSRKSQIAQRASSPEYIEWIWRTKFVDWLSSNESFFWITGRAGSGKSTLMKHVADSRKTKQYLEQNGETWMVVHFFFDFRAGHGFANNLEGMLRSLLYQLLHRSPELTRNIDFMSHDEFFSLDIVSCLEYVSQVADTASFRICAFIDGLDEFEGLGSELVETIYTLEDRARFKLCLASRPYQIFESTFSRYANLTVQEFNNESIQMYVRAQWKNKRLGVQATFPETFSNKIRDKAGGVFLWARLAIDELLQDLLRGKSVADLEAQLNEMPKEVEEMYQRILDRVPAIMRPETAMLLYMILCSKSPEVPIRKLYVALDSLSRRQFMCAARILPIDLDDEEGLSSRIVNLLGDFIDVSPCCECETTVSIHNPGYKDHFPFVIMHENELVMRRGSVPGVSLTHETLKMFLDGNAWVRTFVPAGLEGVTPQHFWIDLYVTEMEIAASINPSGIDSIRSAIRDFVGRVYTLIQKKKWNEVDQLERTLLTILRSWPKWTSLLLLSVQDILREVARCDFVDTVSARRLGTTLQGQVMRYHLAMCCFQMYTPTAFRRRSWLPRDAEHLNTCIYSLPNMLHDRANHIGWSNFFSICHGLPEIVLHNPPLSGNLAEVDEIQELFDHVWKKHCNDTRGNGSYWQTIAHLIKAGARLEGPHICLFFRRQYKHDQDFLPDLVRSLPSVKLFHADECILRRHKDSDSSFLQHWVRSNDDNAKGSEMNELIFEFLLRCGQQLNANFEGEPLLKRLLTIESYEVNDRMRKVITAVRAGANLEWIGESGSARQAAKTLSSYLSRTGTHSQKREAVKIEEMLDKYSQQGSLTESQFAAYARFGDRYLE